MFNASESLRGDEGTGKFLRMNPDGSVLFETDDTPSGQTVLKHYRIYKATPMRRWRVWLRKLGMD